MAKRTLIGLLALAAMGMFAAGCAGPAAVASSGPTGPVAFTPAPGPQVSGTWRGTFYEVASHRTSRPLEGQIELRINDDGTFTETMTGQPALSGKVTVKGNRVVLDSSTGSRLTLMRSGNTLYGLTAQLVSGASVSVRLNRIEQGGQAGGVQQ
jgi:hypothetical protein